jgi:hypothetical protein
MRDTDRDSPADIYDVLGEWCDVFRWSDTEALVIVQGAAAVLRPWQWPGEASEKPVPDVVRSQTMDWLTRNPESTATITLGRLLVWACRRAGQRDDHYSDTEHDHVSWEWHDPQPCGKHAIFNRRLVREALQTFVEAGAGTGTLLSLRMFPERGKRPGREGDMLVIEHGKIACLIMSCNRSDHHAWAWGPDPLPAKWREE